MSDILSDILKGIPVIRLLKEPAENVDELWVRYPQGGEYGWESLVGGVKYYWDKDKKDWLPTSPQSIEDLLNGEELSAGDVPVWTGEKFEVVSLNIYNKEEF